jgi:hypothetical protein
MRTLLAALEKARRGGLGAIDRQERGLVLAAGAVDHFAKLLAVAKGRVP